METKFTRPDALNEEFVDIAVPIEKVEESKKKNEENKYTDLYY